MNYCYYYDLFNRSVVVDLQPNLNLAVSAASVDTEAAETAKPSEASADSTFSSDVNLADSYKTNRSTKSKL
jgi:hypothetical protein